MAQVSVDVDLADRSTEDLLMDTLERLENILEPLVEWLSKPVVTEAHLAPGTKGMESHRLGENKRSRGRPPAISSEHFGTVLSLRSEGKGYGAIAEHLGGLGVFVTRQTVKRMVKGKGAYNGRRQ